MRNRPKRKNGAKERCESKKPAKVLSERIKEHKLVALGKGEEVYRSRGGQVVEKTEEKRAGPCNVRELSRRRH